MQNAARFGRQLLQITPPAVQVLRKRVEFLLCALAWLAVGIFLVINPFADGRGVGNLIGIIVMALLTALCLWATFRRAYGTTLTLYELGFTIAVPGSEVEGFDFRDIKGTRGVRKRLFIGTRGNTPDTSLVHDNPTIGRLNRSVVYVETDTFQRRQKPEGNALARANKSWSQFISVEIEMKTGDEVPVWELSDTLAQAHIERFFTALDGAFSDYLLRDIRREGLDRASVSFGEELTLDRGQFTVSPAMRARRRGRNKQQERQAQTSTIPLDKVWSIRAPRPEDITETSMLKLMSAPNEAGQAEELAVIFLNLALNIDVLYAIVTMNRENREAPGIRT